jgi:signal transduction histidine kinase
MQQEFINTAAHELRNPIQVILGASSILISKKEGDIMQHKETINMINRNAKRLQRLTEDILDVAKIESKNLDLNKRRINLEDLVLNTINDFGSHIKHEGKENEISLDFALREKENAFFVYADIGRITQVIFNLLSNAIKFTEMGSIITTIIKDKCEHMDNNNPQELAVVSIKDTGKGIDPAIKGKLFEKFETKSEKGLGLGLYISRKIIEAHGGKIWAENNNDGNGATFSFSLPLDKQ